MSILQKLLAETELTDLENYSYVCQLRDETFTGRTAYKKHWETEYQKRTTKLQIKNHSYVAKSAD